MKLSSPLPPAVIVGFEANGLGVARALHEFKIPCIAVSTPPRHPAHKTRCCQEIIRCASWDRSALIFELLKIGKRFQGKLPLLITKDEPVLWISESREQLSEYFFINLPSTDIVNLLMDKRMFFHKSKENNWPIPATWMLSSMEELETVIEVVQYPVILKPQLKNSLFRRHSPQKAYKVFNRDQLVSAYKLVAQWEPEVIIQEWIEGGDDRIAYCLSYYGKDGKAKSLFAGRKLRQWPIECGNTAIAAPAPDDWTDSLLKITDDIFTQVGFKGLGSIEFKMRLDDDQPLIMEPTVGRTNYQNEIAVLNGENIPVKAYLDLVGRPDLTTTKQQTKNVKLIDGIREFKAARQYYQLKRISLAGWLSDRSGKKQYMLFRCSDPGPFFASLLTGTRHSVKRFASFLLTSLLGEKNKNWIKEKFLRKRV